MSIWFVIPANQETAFCTAYEGQHVRGTDLPDEDELIVEMVKGTNAAEESVLMTGSSRITSTQADNLGVSHAS